MKTFVHTAGRLALTLLTLLRSAPSTRADADRYLTEVPDYTWYAGCFGTASGNLMGYWDRHGLPNLYTGPTAGGVAPLSSYGSNVGIRSMWASAAGLDGRPANQPGHIDDYWDWYISDGNFSYESTVADEYLRLGRPEHTPDCIGDFIGLNQKKWTNLNNECDGNIDAYSFVFWDPTGRRRVNYQPTDGQGKPIPDIQSGLRAWMRSRGYEADVFTQLTDFNPHTPPGQGFTFEDLKAEIDAGFPVMVFMQPYNEYFRRLTNSAPMPKANPSIHGMTIYGYLEESGVRYARYRTSWASGPNIFSEWNSAFWQAGLPVRGVIGLHPKPKITRFQRTGGQLLLEWDGPSAQIYDSSADATTPVTQYVVERATSLAPANFVPVTDPTFSHQAVLTDCCNGQAFYRVRLVGP